jgi:hypothetical protein
MKIINYYFRKFVPFKDENGWFIYDRCNRIKTLGPYYLVEFLDIERDCNLLKVTQKDSTTGFYKKNLFNPSNGSFNSYASDEIISIYGSDGWIISTESDLMIIYDKYEKVVYECPYQIMTKHEKIDYFKAGYLLLKLDDKFGLYDINVCKIVFDPQFDSILGIFKGDDFKYAKYNVGGRVGLYDLILPSVKLETSFNDIKVLSKELVAIKVQDLWKIHCIDNSLDVDKKFYTSIYPNNDTSVYVVINNRVYIYILRENTYEIIHKPKDESALVTVKEWEKGIIISEYFYSDRLYFNYNVLSNDLSIMKDSYRASNLDANYNLEFRNDFFFFYCHKEIIDKNGFSRMFNKEGNEVNPDDVYYAHLLNTGISKPGLTCIENTIRNNITTLYEHDCIECEIILKAYPDIWKVYAKSNNRIEVFLGYISGSGEFLWGDISQVIKTLWDSAYFYDRDNYILAYTYNVDNFRYRNYTFPLSLKVALEVLNYCKIFIDNGFNFTWEVNKFIDANNLWSEYASIRAKNYHENGFETLGLYTMYFNIVCQELGVRRGDGAELLKSIKY